MGKRSFGTKIRQGEAITGTYDFRAPPSHGKVDPDLFNRATFTIWTARDC